MARRKGLVVTNTIDLRSDVIAPGGSELEGEPSLQQLAVQLMDRARDEGVSLVGPGGLLSGLTKTVLESALDGELTEHLGYDPYHPSGHGSGNSRNGTRTKTVLTEIGPVSLEVPRDRAGTFEPVIVPKRRRRLNGVDALVCSLSAKGLTHGEICAHLREIYGAEISKESITRITDRVLEGMSAWQNRPLDAVYPVIFVDAIYVKIREGQVANRPIYVVIGVTVDGIRDILGLWVGDGGEGAKFWAHVLTEIKNRGTRDVCILVCDGLSGLPEAVSSVWPQTIVQACVVHLLRNSFRYAGRKDWTAIAKDLKPIYTAATEAVALDRLAEFSARWEARYPAIVGLWENAWAEFVPFLAFDNQVREVIYTTDDIVKRSPVCGVASGRRRLRRPVRRGRRVPFLGRVAA
jgi:putative transposase